MISWFLTKNKTRSTTPDELVDVLIQNKDLMYKEGTTNIGGVILYHFKNDRGEAQFSYGSVSITVDSVARSLGRAIICMGTLSNKNGELLECLIKDESVSITTKNGTSEEIPLSAFDSDIDFFQYTLLNLKYECSDASLIKLIKFITEFLDEQSK